MSADNARFVDVYDRIVRRFWASPSRSMTLVELERMIEAARLRSPFTTSHRDAPDRRRVAP